MSELANLEHQHKRIRGALLTNASTLALLGYCLAASSPLAASADENRPTVWIDLGAQVERADNAQSIFGPKFFDLASPVDQNTMVSAQRPSRYAIGEEGKISFEPEGTNWVFSAAVRYGRSNSARHRHHETGGLPSEMWTLGGNLFKLYTPLAREFGDGQASQNDSHLVMDFKAGKDVGLGLFGSSSRSVFSAGVRFAQFTSKADVTLHARPINDVTVKYSAGAYKVYPEDHRTYTAVRHVERNSRAVGPSVSWDASAVVAGSDNGAAVTIDWGIDAAVLFGRQRAKTHHATQGAHHTGLLASYTASSYNYKGPDRVRSKTVTIPSVGGLAGVSLRFPNAKVSLGYRGDFFFGATDSGIDIHRSEDEKFYGPFATISIGLGG